MAKLIVGSQPFDMTAWNLADIAGGTVTSDAAAEVDVTGAGGTLVYQILGTGFTTFDTNGFPTDGTVTGFVQTVPGKTPLTISNISISAADFMSFVSGHDSAGLEAAIFSGGDTFFGRKGNDVLLGYNGNDAFNLSAGGNDTAHGGDGNDSFFFGSAFTAADSVDGGTGTDKLTLAGDYSAGVKFSDTTMVSVENVFVAAGNSYKLSLDRTSDTAGQSLQISGKHLGAADSLNVYGDLIAGSLKLVGGAGGDTLTAGGGGGTILGAAGDDFLGASAGVHGIDAAYTISGGAGNDIIQFQNLVGNVAGDDGVSLNAATVVDGGGGNDTLSLLGAYRTPIVLSGDQFVSIEKILVNTTGDANDGLSTFTVTDNFVPAGHTLTVDASGDGIDQGLCFDGSVETDGQFVITAAHQSGGAQVLIGGAGNDVITSFDGFTRLEGGLGADKLIGGVPVGFDFVQATFVFTTADESTSTDYDTIQNFYTFRDKIEVPTAVNQLFHLSGSLSAATFDADLMAAIGDTLEANSVVQFRAKGGDESGALFLIVDVNGEAGYQAGQDLVIKMTHILNPAPGQNHIQLSNFTTPS